MFAGLEELIKACNNIGMSTAVVVKSYGTTLDICRKISYFHRILPACGRHSKGGFCVQQETDGVVLHCQIFLERM